MTACKIKSQPTKMMPRIGKAILKVILVFWEKYETAGRFPFNQTFLLKYTIFPETQLFFEQYLKVLLNYFLLREQKNRQVKLVVYLAVHLGNKQTSFIQ